MTDPYENFYKVLNTFSGISFPEFERVRHLFHKRKIPKDAFFIRSGEKPVSFAFVSSGLFRSFYCTDAGEEYTKNFVKLGEIIAAYSSYLAGTDSSINIEALKDSLILDCKFKEFTVLTESSLPWERFRRKLSDLLFIQREIREFELLTLDAADRYRKFLEKFSEIENEITDYNIASYLGITPVSFSRIRKKIRNNNKSN